MLRRTFVGMGAVVAASGRWPARASVTEVDLTAQADYRYDRSVIEARPGDTVQIRFRNSLPEPTNLHYHGLHVSPDVDDSMLRVPPNATAVYNLEIPADHRCGTFWFHPHVYGRTSVQVGRGLSGAFLIRGGLDDLPGIAAMPERVWLLQDNPVETAPTFFIDKNGWLRLRIINATRASYYRLRIEQHELHVIAIDGGTLPSPSPVASYLLPPGGRVEVCIKAGQPTGAYSIFGGPYSVVGTLVYSPATAQENNIPETLIREEPLPAAAITRTFVLDHARGMGGMMGGGMGSMMSFTINGKTFDPGRVDTEVNLAAVEDWEFINNTGMDHPMHIHTNPFQVLDAAGTPIPVWRDVVNVPGRSRVLVRTQFRAFAGLSMYHCHILEHEDAGMMATLRIHP